MSIAVACSSQRPGPGLGPIRVMVVDDAVVVRSLLARWIDAEPGLRFVGSMRNGREAIEQLERADPDVVILDIDMPEVDGLTALPQLLKKRRDLIVIMASTLTQRNAEISLRALARGAADYIPKPQIADEIMTSALFRCELIARIRALSSRRRVPFGARPAAGSGVDGVGHPEASPSLVPHHAGAMPLRPFPALVPRVLLVGASTGGPQALQRLLAGLGAVIERVPVVVVQHMPATFTAVLAEHLTRGAGWPVHEAVDREVIHAGRIYLAPGGRHLRVAGDGGQPVIALDDGPPVNFCKPAVDPLFASAASVWGARAMAVVLTGMGADGTRGADALVAAGGAVIAQDEGSSVVWGMPGSVAHAGYCCAVLPLDQIAPRLARLFLGERR